MNYELAKQLKDAGFPSEEPIQLCPENCVLRHYYHYSNAPTLEELIEACGDGFKFCELTLVGDEWHAKARRENGIPEYGKGSTPTEAVARLWLALNPKK